jgi:hypothetical protein
MSRHDERLQNLVLARAEAALGMASFLLSVADPCQEVDYNDIVIEPSAIRNMQDDLLQLEALTCGLMHDAGMSWDTIASYYEVARQSLHRRLQPPLMMLSRKPSGTPTVVRRRLLESIEMAQATLEHLATSIEADIARSTQVWSDRRRTPGW